MLSMGQLRLPTANISVPEINSIIPNVFARLLFEITILEESNLRISLSEKSLFFSTAYFFPCLMFQFFVLKPLVLMI